jgi:hypothetical protein
MAKLNKLNVVCPNQDCGDPVPFSRKNTRRLMSYAGTQFSGNAVYLCPECGRRRYFSVGYSGVLKEMHGDCFVACAVYGEVDAPEVCELRRWRDQSLRQHRLGRAFVSSYYAWLGPLGVRLVSLTGEPGRRTARKLLDQLVTKLKHRKSQHR